MIQTAYFAAGCFWCTEAVFQRLKGVISVQSGYMGGTIKNPAYREVCQGRTGHAEGVEVQFDATEISYHILVIVFFSSHDPTTLNRQGADVGTQYRSAIFYTDATQQATAITIIEELTATKIFSAPIVTELTAFTNFYPAEAEHHEFYNTNTNHPYCQAVIEPKLEKFTLNFKKLLKNE